MQVPDKWKFNLVCLLEGHDNIHTIISDTLVEAGTKTIENMIFKVSYTLG